MKEKVELLGSIEIQNIYLLLQILLYNGNTSLSVADLVHMKETYENFTIILQKLTKQFMFIM